MASLPIDILRSIRKYLPLPQARELRTLRKGMEHFHRFEIDELYHPDILETFIREDYQVGIDYLLKRYKALYMELYPITKIRMFIRTSNLQALYCISYYPGPRYDNSVFRILFRKSIYNAIKKNDLPLVATLLKLGIYMGRKGNELIFAINEKNYDIVKYLIRTQEYDLNENMGGRDNSPLTAAIETQELAMVKILVEAGASLTNMNVDDQPITVAIFTGNYEIVQYLISMGADLNHHYDRAIQVALRLEDFDIIKLLVRAGATIQPEDIEYSSKYNFPPVAPAQGDFRAGNPEITYYLRNPD